MTRRVPLPTLVLAVATAFLLGSVGTAVAGPALTEKTVKKIATKVVKKRAPKLTVKDSQKLDGRPAAAYEERAIVFVVPKSTPATIQTITLPLDEGKYLITYSALLAGGSGISQCRIESEYDGMLVALAGEESAGGALPIMSGTGYLAVNPGDVVTVACYSESAWITFDTQPIQVVVQELDRAEIGAAS